MNVCIYLYFKDRSNIRDIIKTYFSINILKCDINTFRDQGYLFMLNFGTMEFVYIFVWIFIENICTVHFIL